LDSVLLSQYPELRSPPPKPLDLTKYSPDPAGSARDSLGVQPRSAPREASGGRVIELPPSDWKAIAA
jgi:hypothetical protein